MSLSLRPYQQRTLDELMAWFEGTPEGNPIVSACVGAGKSVMIAELCRMAARGYQDYRSRVLITVPSKELLEQNYAKLVALAPDLRIGVVSASAGRKDTAFDKDVVIATPGSVVKQSGNLGRLDLILVDECHLIPTKDQGQYRELIKGCQQFNRDLRVIGWTGSPFRGNGVWLTSGQDRLFTDIAARVTLDELLTQGFLSPLTPGVPNLQISGDGIAVDAKTGDYRVNALAERLDQADIVERVAEEICRMGADRKKWLVFAVTVKHAEHLAQAIHRRGISATHVSGETPKAERERIIAGFRQGRFRCLVNVAVLTTGFDVPEVDLLALVRNTKSPVLYTQIAGRAMRIAEGKTDALWLDFTDTTLNLGPVNEIKGRNEPKPREGDVSAPFKICSECGKNNPAGAQVCAHCGDAFPEPDRKMYGHVNGADVLSGATFGYKDIHVARMTYRSHQSKRTDQFMLKAEYWSGMRMVCSEYICLEHTGYARHKAERWWRERYAGKLDLPVPSSVVHALDMVNWLREPKRITVKYGGKFPELIAARFDEKEAA